MRRALVLLLFLAVPLNAAAEGMVVDGGDFGPDGGNAPPPLPPDAEPDSGVADPIIDSGSGLFVDQGVFDTGVPQPSIDTGPRDFGGLDAFEGFPDAAPIADASAGDSSARDLGTVKPECGCNTTTPSNDAGASFGLLLISALFLRSLRRSL